MADRGRFSRRLPPLGSEPDVPEHHKRAVWGALRWAWSEAMVEHQQVLARGHEEDVTMCLQALLNERDVEGKRRARGLSVFETVVRGAKMVSADALHIEKAPDLAFRPMACPGVRNQGHWGLFVECKIIAPKPHHSPEKYCTEGVSRFVSGQYSSRMPCGAMLAYVRDGRLPHPTLKPLLSESLGTQSFVPTNNVDMCRSQHGRGSLSQPCVDVLITHLWLQGPPSGG